MQIACDRLIRRHTKSSYRDAAVVVWLEDVERAERQQHKQRYWYIEIPGVEKYQNKKMRNKGERSGTYIGAVHVGLVEDIQKEVQRGLVTFIERDQTSVALYSDDDFQADPEAKLLSANTRRHTPLWKKHRDGLLPQLRAIQEKGDDYIYLIEEGGAEERIEELVADIKDRRHRKSQRKKLQQIWRRFLIGHRMDNALLPNWAALGAPGKAKRFTAPPGPESIDGNRPYLMTELDILHCRQGWKKYKKEGVSDASACRAILKEFYAKSVVWKSPTECTVVYLPKHPTHRQIKNAGKSDDPALSSARIAMGQNIWNRQKRPIQSGRGGRVVAVGQLGVLDATSDDQRPVSTASRRKRLPSTWRTVIADAKSEYIVGIYRGFEKGGAIPALLAMLHGAQPKDEWFEKKMGRPLQPGEWHSLSFKGVQGDAGDLKNETGITALTISEISLEFTRSYAAEHKMIEVKHKVLHRGAGHLYEGSTRGKTKSRGEKDDGTACLTMDETWPGYIERILIHNNIELVPHLLDLEMRRYFDEHNIPPTRKAIFEYCREVGYVASEPLNLDYMRAHCLPRLRAKIHREGIRVFDPRSTVDKPRYIPHLVYSAKWLDDSGLKGGDLKECEIHIDPSNIGFAWININGLKQLQLTTDDEEKRNVSLFDWLTITDDDKLIQFLNFGNIDAAKAGAEAAIRAANKSAKTALKKEEAVAGKRTGKNTSSAKKRANLEEEQKRQKEEQLGVQKLPKRNAESLLDELERLLGV